VQGDGGAVVQTTRLTVRAIALLKPLSPNESKIGRLEAPATRLACARRKTHQSTLDSLA
jgi:hypothetical protein